MTDIDDDCAELAALWPALAAALARDTASTGDTPGGTWTSATVVNADVLTAMIALGRDIPAAIARACQVTGEPWRNRDLLGHLRQVPRLAARMHDTGRPDGERELARDAAAWLRTVKRALGLRKPDIAIGYPCPWAGTRPENHPGTAMLLAAGAEGFLRPGADGLRVEWVTSGQIYCPASACGATWGPAQWPLLGRMLETTAAP
jgi:hypothetical protein